MSEETKGPAQLQGYFPGVIGKITELHALYYHEHWGFNVSFETQVGKELSEFIRDFREGRDFFRAAAVDGQFAGAVAVDDQPSSGEGVRLRWFIVAPRFQGRGIGTRLLREALDFCKGCGYERIFLWTFQGLDSARRLYEKMGFQLRVEHDISQWGQRIKEQMFEMTL